MLPRSMEMGKRYFGEKVFNRVFNYLKKDPENNLEKALDLMEKAPIAEHHREYIKNTKKRLEDNPAIREYINRVIKEVDENVQNHLINNFFVNASLVGVPKKQQIAEKVGFNIPYTILIDPTSSCNLQCTGCWAGAYEKHHKLSFEEVDRIVSEAKELGIHFIVMSGGEPMLWPHLAELCRKHYDVAFMIYTNGTLIDEDTAKWMREVGNISPAISLEGGREATDRRRGGGVYDKIMTAMDHLRNHGVAFGFSITITDENCDEVYSDQFIDMLIEKGALYGWSFHYIPIGSSPDFSLLLNPEKRAELVDRVRYLRKNKPIQIADFWNDGELTGGCIAGGRQYFHITASGNVEPCAFVHFTVDSIKDKSLKEVLTNPVFQRFQENQPFSENLLRPCPLIDVPEKLREIVEETDARPTYEGADAIMHGEASKKMDKRAAAWKDISDKKWKELQKSKSKEEVHA